MKRKILVSIIVLIITSMLLLIIPKNKEDILYAVTIDGKKVDSFPEHGNYNVNVKCDNATGKWNYTKWIVDVTEITGDYICEVAFTTSNKQNLNDYIISLNNQEVGDGLVTNEIVSIDKSTFTAGDKISQSSYTNLSNDTTYPYTWNDTDKTWTSSNHTDSTTSTISFNVSSTGDYQICYMQQSEKNFDFATIKKDNVEIKSLKGISNSSYECYILGNLTTSNVITISYKKDGSSSTQPDNVVFYLQSGINNKKYKNVNAGYRYEGSNPNNYILFNDELWRIIGVFDSTTHGADGNLVKIIRNDSIGGLVYNTSKGINSWGESTLYKLLNQESGDSYYTGIDYTNKSRGTYCSSYDGDEPQDCSFSIKGIRNDYARNMIKKAKWYSTAYEDIGTASDTYTKDTITTISTEGYIGLMYASDYGYAVKASDCARTISLDSYGKNGLICAGKNWLKSGKFEWTISRYDTDDSWRVSYAGSVGNLNKLPSGYSVRPTLYLKSDVYYVGGTGSYDDPIIIGY